MVSEAVLYSVWKMSWGKSKTYYPQWKCIGHGRSREIISKSYMLFLFITWVQVALVYRDVMD